MYTVTEEYGAEARFEELIVATAYANLRSNLTLREMAVEYDCVLTRQGEGSDLVFSIYGRERTGFSIYDRCLWSCNLSAGGASDEGSTEEVNQDGRYNE